MMDDNQFDQIIRLWQQIEQQSLTRFTSKRTNQCLTFEQLGQSAAGKLKPSLQSHIASCDHCQQMIKLFQRYQPAPKPAPEKKRWQFQSLQKWYASGQKGSEKMVGAWNWLPTAARYVIPAVALAILIFILLPRPESKLAALARIEPIYYQPISARSETTTSEVEEIYQTGMRAYSEKNYSFAIQRLQQVVEMQPENPYPGFYLGLCYLLNKQTTVGIAQLTAVAEKSPVALQEKCYWYLGNAYLLQEDASNALKMLKQVIELRGDYEWEARALIEEIVKMINQN